MLEDAAPQTPRHLIPSFLAPASMSLSPSQANDSLGTCREMTLVLVKPPSKLSARTASSPRRESAIITPPRQQELGNSMMYMRDYMETL